MTDEHLVPPGDQPVRIRWLNAAEQNPSLPKPTAQHAFTPTVKTVKVTAPSVINKTRTKAPSANNNVRFVEQAPPPTSSVDTTIQSSKGIKELSAEDKLKIANLIKELARLGHEKELMEGKLDQERRLFENQMKTVLTDYEKLMKDNQKLLSRYNETKNLLSEYEKKSQSTMKSTPTEFPNPQRSSTPINHPCKEPSPSAAVRAKSESESQQSARVSLLQEQFHLKQLMMEKQLELLQKQQQILESELHQKNLQGSNEKSMADPIKSTTTRATSPMKREQVATVIERATSPVKQTTTTTVKHVEPTTKRSIQTQRFEMNTNDEDLLILSLNESLHEPKAKTSKSRSSSSNPMDPEEQNLLKDIFFIC